MPDADRETDRDVLARTLYGEARGEPWQGMLAVAQVVMNRVAHAARHVARTGRPHALYGDGTVRSACLVRRQFSCWNVGDTNLPKLLKAGPESVGWRGAWKAAGMALDGSIPDLVHGATHYHRRDVRPPWVGDLAPVVEIGDHMFYDLGERG